MTDLASENTGDSGSSGPLQNLRARLGSINTLTQREVDQLIARLRSQGRSDKSQAPPPA
ncbi:MAG: hypothetical protein NTV23_00825 [Propionibacteriales bacterium]|nr:hypothetical protein [Propionibacteriales bacterium]